MLNGPTCSSLEKIWHIHMEVLPSADNEQCADSTAGTGVGAHLQGARTSLDEVD